uniref:Uncharacterized protein n=1 Tax=Megaselia scalaris TaxID=36166 RepID=T1GHP4_MEGSC
MGTEARGMEDNKLDVKAENEIASAIKKKAGKLESWRPLRNRRLVFTQLRCKTVPKALEEMMLIDRVFLDHLKDLSERVELIGRTLSKNETSNAKYMQFQASSQEECEDLVRNVEQV